jgi:hypothetical protein
MTGREADIVERLRHHVAEAETDAVPARSLWRCVPVSELREAADIIERLSQENDGLRTALAKIRDDDTRDSHPCGPQEYGYFGGLADAALRLPIPSNPTTTT